MQVKIVIKPQILAVLGVFLFQLCNAPCSAQVNFKISPPAIDMILGRGGTKVFSFELINEDREHSLAFTMVPVDVDMTREGTTEFRDAGTTPYSCSDWIEVEPKNIVLEPGQTKKIIGKISVPARVGAGGYYGAVACELSAADALRQLDSTIKWRIASLIKVTVSGGRIEKKARIEDFFLRTLFEDRQTAPHGLTFLASVRNLGNIHIAAAGKLVILTPDRRRKGEVDFNVGTGTVLPGHTREFTAVYDRVLPEGQYIGRAMFRYGGSAAIEKEIPFAVTSGQPRSAPEEQMIVGVAAVQAVPETLSLKIPPGGFRTAGFAVRNQSAGEVRIAAGFDRQDPLKTWFSCAPERMTIPSGTETKIVLSVSVPQDAPDGPLQTAIVIMPAAVSENGVEETLDPVHIGINIEIPKK